MGNTNIELKPMTRELCHALFREWENDPDIYSDMSLFKPFIYTEEYEKYHTKFMKLKEELSELEKEGGESDESFRK